MSPIERDNEVRLRALRLAIAWLSRRWFTALAAAFAAGCVTALAFRLLVAGRSWEATAQGVGFFLGLLGVVMGLMLAYGGRGTMGTSHRDPSGERLRGVAHPARPLAGFAEVLFCLPTVVATLTM